MHLVLNVLWLIVIVIAFVINNVHGVGDGGGDGNHDASRSRRDIADGQDDLPINYKRGVTMVLIAVVSCVLMYVAYRKLPTPKRAMPSQVNQGTNARKPAYLYRMTMKFAFPSDDFDYDRAIVVIGTYAMCPQ